MMPTDRPAGQSAPARARSLIIKRPSADADVAFAFSAGGGSHLRGKPQAAPAPLEARNSAIDDLPPDAAAAAAAAAAAVSRRPAPSVRDRRAANCTGRAKANPKAEVN